MGGCQTSGRWLCTDHVVWEEANGECEELRTQCDRSLKQGGMEDQGREEEESVFPRSVD